MDGECLPDSRNGDPDDCFDHVRISVEDGVITIFADEKYKYTRAHFLLIPRKASP